MNEDTAHNPSTFARFSTGVPGLDTVLRTGFLRGGVYIVEGNPGAGKTILGNQVSFAHVAGGGRVVYLTLVAESHARMLGHMRSMTFENPTVIGDALYYLSGFSALLSGGLDGLLNLARETVQDHRATLLVLDGLATVQEMAGTPLAMRNFIQRFQLFLETAGCTALLLMRPEEATQTPIHTMVDGVVNLRDEMTQGYPTRYLSVQKFRGSGYLRGDHTYDITEAGITIYPRTEALYTAPQQIAGREREAMTFGASHLDAMIRGNLLSGSTTILYGAAGTGKTLLGMQFLHEGVRREQPGLYFGFYEQPHRLLTSADRLGLALRGATERGLLEWRWQPPLEQSIDALAEQLLVAVDRGKVRRLVLDGLDQMRLSSFPRERFPRFFAALSNELRARDVTCLITYESQDIFTTTVTMPDNIGSIVDNVFFLRPVEMHGRLYRHLSLLKMREGEYDHTIRELRITDVGVDVADLSSPTVAVASEDVKLPMPAVSPTEPHDDDNSRR